MQCQNARFAVLSLGSTLALDPEHPPVIASLAHRFGVEDMRRAPRDAPFLGSLLYFLGALTLKDQTPFGELVLGIPNLVIRKLYVEKFRDGLFPEYPEREEMRRFALLDHLLEFKCLNLQDLGLTAETLRVQSREQLASLPAVAASLDAAEAQLARYRTGLERAYGERLHTHALVALGFERLLWRSSPGVSTTNY